MLVFKIGRESRSQEFDANRGINHKMETILQNIVTTLNTLTAVQQQQQQLTTQQQEIQRQQQQLWEQRVPAASASPATSGLPLYKSIAHIKAFGGARDELTQFLTCVDTHLADNPDTEDAEVYKAIYNTKIVGEAKTLLYINGPKSWAETRKQLVQYFRPVIDINNVWYKINNLKVNSILDLCSNIELILKECHDYALYELNHVEIINSCKQLLIAKIKELTVGQLSREIRNKFDLSAIIDILRTYIPDSEWNLKKNYRTSFVNRSNSIPTENNRVCQNNNSHVTQAHNRTHNKSGQARHPFNTRSGQTKQNNSRYGQERQNSAQVFNPSGQARNSRQNPQPMDVDYLTSSIEPSCSGGTGSEEINNIDPASDFRN